MPCPVVPSPAFVSALADGDGGSVGVVWVFGATQAARLSARRAVSATVVVRGRGEVAGSTAQP